MPSSSSNKATKRDALSRPQSAENVRSSIAAVSSEHGSAATAVSTSATLTLATGMTVDDALKTDLVKVAFVMSFLLIVVGPITGPQQIFHAVAERGVYSDRCDKNFREALRNFTENTDGFLRDAWQSPLLNGKNLTALAVVAADPNIVVELPCLEQEQAIEWAADLFLSVSNFVCGFNGILVDLLGAHRMAIGGTLVWIISKSCAGLNPASGIVWTSCQAIAAIAGLGSYLGVGLVHLKEACPDPKKYAFWCFLGSAFWDLAVLFNVPLSFYYRWRALSLAQCYAIYGLCVGSPYLLGFVLMYRTRLRQQQLSVSSGGDGDAPPRIALGDGGDEGDARRDGEEAVSSDDNADVTDERTALVDNRSRPKRKAAPRDSACTLRSDGGDRPNTAPSPTRRSTASMSAASGTILSSPIDTAEGLSGKARVFHLALAARAIICTPIYLVFVVNACMVVTIGYYLIASVATVARYMGLDPDAAHDSRLITTFMMSAIGLLSVVPGRMLQMLGTRRGLVLCLSFEVFWMIATIAAFSVRKGAVPMYCGFTAMLIWRVWGFGLSSPFLSWRFYKQRSSIGFAYGFAYTVAGAVSAVWGSLTHNMVKKDAARYFPPIVIGTMIVCALAQLLFAICIARTTDADPTEELQAHARLLAKSAPTSIASSPRSTPAKNTRHLDSINDA